jgi:hypothetical protein
MPEQFSLAQFCCQAAASLYATLLSLSLPHIQLFSLPLAVSPLLALWLGQPQMFLFTFV